MQSLRRVHSVITHVLVSQVLEQLQLAVCPFRKHRGAEGLHDLLDGDALVGQLVPGRAGKGVKHSSAAWTWVRQITIIEGGSISPNEPKGAHANWLEIGIPNPAISYLTGVSFD
jgi:hypothetical protein